MEALSVKKNIPVWENNDNFNTYMCLYVHFLVHKIE